MPAPMFTVNAHRYDPYRTFKFQVVIDGRPVAGLKKMSALKKKTEAVKWRSAGDPSHERVLPGGTSYEPVTLEQGLTHDTVFEDWANLVNNIEGDAALSLKNYRKDLVINLDAGTMNAVGIQSITIQHEGWQRDTSVQEPTES